MDGIKRPKVNKPLNFEMSKRRFIKISFKEMKSYSEQLARRIIEEHGAPEVIIYAQRGGMLIGRLLSDALGVRDLVCISAKYYSKSNRRYSRVIVGSIPQLKVKGYALLVDDIADTGKTLNEIRSGIAKKSKAKLVTCTFGMKPQTVIRPDFYSFSVSNDTWVVFEYEEFEAMRNFSATGNDAGLRFIKKNF
jgi:hypoxanthine phosphoribosyltransferase